MFKVINKNTRLIMLNIVLNVLKVTIKTFELTTGVYIHLLGLTKNIFLTHSRYSVLYRG